MLADIYIQSKSLDKPISSIYSSIAYIWDVSSRAEALELAKEIAAKELLDTDDCQIDYTLRLYDDTKLIETIELTKEGVERSR